MPRWNHWPATLMALRRGRVHWVTQPPTRAGMCMVWSYEVVTPTPSSFLTLGFFLPNCYPRKSTLNSLWEKIMTYIPVYCVVVPRALSFSRCQFEMLRLKSSYKVQLIDSFSYSEPHYGSPLGM
uniref:Uncharacterized protein n=1 Tax=Myotis myotis TaxID=51298 RepID=A0A7J8AMS6_MYOMY|nr:hypothetical protein mMyoMyo1_008182 [Myotis myotis]